jgi:hypothetical protein
MCARERVWLENCTGKFNNNKNYIQTYVMRTTLGQNTVS